MAYLCGLYPLFSSIFALCICVIVYCKALSRSPGQGCYAVTSSLACSIRSALVKSRRISCISRRLSTSHSASWTTFSTVVAEVTIVLKTARRVVLISDQIDGCTSIVFSLQESDERDCSPASRIELK